MDNQSKNSNNQQDRPHHLHHVNGKLIAEKKREKFQKKLEKKLEQERKIQERNDWFKTYSRHSTLLDMKEVKALKRRAKEFETMPMSTGSIASTGNSPDENDDVRGTTRKRPRLSSSEGHSYSNSLCSIEIDERKTTPTTLLDLVRPYMDLKDSSGDDMYTNTNTMQTRITHKKDRYFIAEGTETVRMLMEQSANDMQREDQRRERELSSTSSDNLSKLLLEPIKIYSILTKPSSFFEEPVHLKQSLERAFSLCHNNNDGGDDEHRSTGEKNNSNHKSTAITAAAAAAAHGRSLPFHVLVGAENILNEIVGYPVARGAMACGRVPHYDEKWLRQYVGQRLEQHQGEQQQHIPSIRILALDKIDDTANLGSIIRSAAAFGIHVILISNDSCDVWYRRCVRVSMGHALTVPSIRVPDLASTITSLRERHQVVSYAAVIDKDAEMVLERTENGGIHRNWCCVLGNEGNGISPNVVSSCDHRIRIDMKESVDSLSVGVAAGIILHGLREREVC